MFAQAMTQLREPVPTATAPKPRGILKNAGKPGGASENQCVSAQRIRALQCLTLVYNGMSTTCRKTKTSAITQLSE